jgi:hypothetical protein
MRPNGGSVAMDAAVGEDACFCKYSTGKKHYQEPDEIDQSNQNKSPAVGEMSEFQSISPN